MATQVVPDHSFNIYLAADLGHKGDFPLLLYYNSKFVQVKELRRGYE